MERINAKDKKCCICGEQADVFWPVIDPDIEAHPYCDKCVKKEKMKLLEALFNIDGEGDDDE